MKKIAALLLVLVCLTGCVDRSIQIDSEPRGALVVLDEVRMGYTPLTIPFAHYGTREIRLEKKGYTKVTMIEEIEKPWYQTAVVGFFADVLWPFTIEDIHFFKVTMYPLEEERSTGLMNRAVEARERLKTKQGVGSVK